MGILESDELQFEAIDLDRQRLGGLSKHRALPMGSSHGKRECTILEELQVVPYGIYKECPKVISSLTTTYNGIILY